jgi:hypothetical protein
MQGFSIYCKINWRRARGEGRGGQRCVLHDRVRLVIRCTSTYVVLLYPRSHGNQINIIVCRKYIVIVCRKYIVSVCRRYIVIVILQYIEKPCMEAPCQVMREQYFSVCITPPFQ